MNNMFLNIYNWIKRHKILNGLFCLYFLFNSYLYLNTSAINSDEILFTEVNYSFGNLAGYGNLYWIFIKTFKNLFFLRLVALLCMISIPIAIHKFGGKFNIKSESTRYAAMFLWLTFPAAWWYGKLIGCEIYATALGFWGLYLAYHRCGELLSKKHYIGILMMGVAMGIKLNFVIFSFSYFGFLFLSIPQKNWIKRIIHCITNKTVLKSFLLVLLGFFIGTPSFLYSPSSYFKELKFFIGEFELTLTNLYYKHIVLTWDLVPLPSLSAFSLSIVTCFVLIILFLVYRKKILNSNILIVLIASFIILILMLSKSSQKLFPWYHYALIVIIPFLFYAIKLKKQILWCVIILNFVISSPVIFTQIYTKILWLNQNIDDKSIKFIKDVQKMTKKKYVVEEYVILKPCFKNMMERNLENFIDKCISKTIKNKSKITLAIFSKQIIIGIAIKSNTPIKMIKKLIYSNTIVADFEKILAQNNEKVENIGNYKDVYAFLIYN